MRRSKFGNRWTVVDGIKFQSRGEAARYCVLRDREAAGLIEGLRRQVVYPLTVNDQAVCRYVADFTYMADGREVVEDFKGLVTPTYRLKAKLMKAVHGIEIHEVFRPDA